MNELSFFLLILVLFQVASFAATWRLFKLAGHKSWKAAVPVLSQYTILQIAERPKWWIVFIFLPVIGPIMLLIIYGELIRVFGKRTTLDLVATVFLGLFYVGYLNYDKKTKFEGVEERKETFVASILFAVILATTIHTYLVQPMIIPTGSMENTLRIGDALFVEKVSFGSRVPNTPVAIPFSDIFYRKGYLKEIQLPYMRLPGWRSLKPNDIVVFNYPADTVHVPVDRRDPYVKRLVGMPGDTLTIQQSELFVNGKAFMPKKDAVVQYSYSVETKDALSPKYLDEKFELVNTDPQRGKMDYFFQGKTPSGNSRYIFLGLSDAHLEMLRANKNVVAVERQIQTEPNNSDLLLASPMRANDSANALFPLRSKWNRDNFGPLYIPKKGAKIQLNASNLDQYHDLINEYEKNDLHISGGKLFKQGKEVATAAYTVQQDYYFMMGDNRHNSADSRFFGYVPEDHILGRPVMLWANLNQIFGFEKKHGWKWARWFTIPNTGEPNKTSYRYIALVLFAAYFGYDWWQNKKKKAKAEK